MFFFPLRGHKLWARFTFTMLLAIYPTVIVTGYYAQLRWLVNKPRARMLSSLIRDTKEKKTARTLSVSYVTTYIFRSDRYLDYTKI